MEFVGRGPALVESRILNHSSHPHFLLSSEITYQPRPDSNPRRLAASSHLPNSIEPWWWDVGVTIPSAASDDDHGAANTSQVRLPSEWKGDPVPCVTGKLSPAGRRPEELQQVMSKGGVGSSRRWGGREGGVDEG